MENGHLILEAGANKNITFRTKGTGSLNFLSQTPEESPVKSQAVTLAGNGANILSLEERVSKLEQKTDKNSNLPSRISQLEAAINDSIVSL